MTLKLINVYSYLILLGFQEALEVGDVGTEAYGLERNARKEKWFGMPLLSNDKGSHRLWRFIQT